MRNRKTFWLVMVLGLSLLASVMAGCGSSEKPAAAPAATPAATPAAKAPVVIRVSHQPEFETFLTYRAMKEGLDTKVGLKIDLKYFDSGMPQIEALPANQWDVGATGGVPALMGALRYNSYVIAIANDESLANVVMARPDNPVFQTKGSNPKYPNVFGAQNQVRGKEMLVTTVSSGHYALSSYLNTVGLKDSDVKVMNLEQAQAVAAFDSGQGDFVTLWAPFMYTGLQKGWKVVASGDQVGANIPLLIVANKKFADENPELVVKFLDMYFQKIDEMKAKKGALAPEYKAFLKDWAGMDMTLEDSKLDLEKHPVFTLQEQLKMMDGSKGSSEVQQWMEGIAGFFTSQGKFTAAEKDKVLKSGFVNDKFIKMLAAQKGIK